MRKGELIGGADRVEDGDFRHLSPSRRRSHARILCQNSSKGRRSSNTGGPDRVASFHSPTAQAVAASAIGDFSTVRNGSAIATQRRRGTKIASPTAAAAKTPAPTARRT